MVILSPSFDVRDLWLLSLGPGSFIEVTKVLPLLTASEAGHPSFHVVAPSLPGFAWSEAVSKRGFGPRQYAEVRTLNN
jgi:hypothetical protein